jgi:hypothetical protein
MREGVVLHPVISDQIAELEQLCQRYRVRQLALFGSAATNQGLTEASDLDFLVEFEPLPAGVYADTYFGLLEALQCLFGRPVDLVVESAIKNPYFLQEISATRMPLYET